jgi:CRISP-associated protein Cas1
VTLFQNEFGHDEIQTCPQLAKAYFELGDAWAHRNQYWIEEAAHGQRPRRKRERNPHPLILCGHGISLRIEHGALVIRDGFTHYPQQQTTYRFFPRDLDLPTRIMLLDGSGSLSFEVLTWLCQQGVSLARVSWTGEVATVTSGTGYAADPAKLQWQHQTRADQRVRFQFAADIIRQKLVASLETLEHIQDSRSREVARSKATIGIGRLESGSFADMNDIFAIEGECASAYFAAWHGLEMQWKGLARRPIPSGWQVYSGRSSLATGVKAENRNASHPLNAMLNYAYAVKLAALQVQAIADGYDPTFGIMHNGKRGNPAFVLDLIELERPHVDGAILQMIAEQKFAAADFIIRPNGSCRLAPQLARAVATKTLSNNSTGV